ncbi:riboflavin synthase [Leadbetterella sp. DM7]|uniref:riboflavin synthase n=1 Tax=Leadbetterella sp. DM7 TaxID=3235085 RepID=UPI00349E4B2E
MFTGIVETTAVVTEITPSGSSLCFRLESPLARELKVDQSVSHNGVCLTVEETGGDTYRVTAIRETLLKTNLGTLKTGDRVNLERCLKSDGRFDGHIVQGHVDQTGICTGITDQNGSWLLDFEYDASTGNVTVEKGSVCVNGISLTVFNSQPGRFSVAIIPYTWENTGLKDLETGDTVNLEFDIIGKYVARLLQPFQ